MEYYKSVGNKIKKARKELGISQGDLAQFLGKKSSTYIALIEAGKRKISLETLHLVAEHLHKPLSHFVGVNLDTKTPEELLKFALQADEELSPAQKKKIIKFYQFVKTHE